MQYPLTEAISELIGVEVREGSVNAMLHCPFHEDRTPSFSIHLVDGIWHCFSCGDSGSINQLYRRLGKDVDYGVRLVQAKQRAEAPIIKTRNFAAMANGFINARSGERAQDFLEDFLSDRPISPSAVANFGLGFSSERDAISFPYEDVDGRVTGLKYRHRDGSKSSETGSTYGLYGVTNGIGKKNVIICEGETDTLAVWSSYGQDYGVCGTSGASVSAAQWARFGLHFLFARTIYLLYDADEPGDKCAATAMSVLGNDKCVRLRPDHGDACDFLGAGNRLEEIGLGRPLLERA